jgi:hypothetical protein
MNSTSWQLAVFLPLLFSMQASGGLPMLFSRRTIFLLLIAGAPCLSGCNTSHARSAPVCASAGRGQVLTSPVAKHAPRDSAFAVYNNPTYGVSFRYPRNFELQEAFEPSSMKPLEQLTGPQSDSIPVAAVVIPNDAFPNTAFRGGYLQFAVNPAVKPESCQSFVVPRDPDWRDSTGTFTISGSKFLWWQSRDVANHMDYYTRIYAGFFHGACYEFYLEVTDSISMVPDPAEKPADSQKILRQLDKIVSSLQLSPPAPVAHPPKP